MSGSAMTALWACVGIVIALAGVGVLVMARGGVGDIRLAGVGRLSRVTWAVFGMALFGVGYHIFSHTTGLFVGFRAPLGVAVGIGVAAMLGALAIDAVENRHGQDEGG